MHQIGLLGSRRENFPLSLVEGGRSAATQPSKRHEDRALVQRVASAVRARGERNAYFGSDLFSDPAWDILLELYLSELLQRPISVSKVAMATTVPSTTVIRWLAALEDKGLVIRQSDNLDGRRVWVSLSEAGSLAMRAYFEALPIT